METNDVIAILKNVGEKSTTITTWSLSIVGASLLSIISTSYIKPQSIPARLMYFLFLPGWFFLGISIYSGNQISGRIIASSYAACNKRIDVLNEINIKINEDFSRQIDDFQYGFFLFSIWLCIFILWWIFNYKTQ